MQASKRWAIKAFARTAAEYVNALDYLEERRANGDHTKQLTEEIGRMKARVVVLAKLAGVEAPEPLTRLQYWNSIRR